MTGRTHDLGALTGLSLAFAWHPQPQMTLATLIVALVANMIGGLAPDLDQSTSSLWGKIRGGSLIGKLLAPILGGHRLISHSLLGLVLTGFFFNVFLNAAGRVLLVDMSIVWWAFMIGHLSHLILDSCTKEGVPWFFPFPFELGFPPFRALRLKTGGLFEKSFIFPGLILLNGYIYAQNYFKLLDFLRSLAS